jgi:hypothetical protein
LCILFDSCGKLPRAKIFPQISQIAQIKQKTCLQEKYANQTTNPIATQLLIEEESTPKWVKYLYMPARAKTIPVRGDIIPHDRTFPQENISPVLMDEKTYLFYTYNFFKFVV